MQRPIESRHVPRYIHGAGTPALLREGEAPRLVVAVHTEEEFDWNAPFDRSATSVRAMASVGRLQEVFEEYGIRPAYMADFPVASQPEGAAPLQELAAAGRAEIGAHLHPWVTPPHEEEVGPRSSYPGNLPPELEEAKLDALLDAVEAGIGVRPRSYLAGRYGRGPHTARILASRGIRVDLSPSPPFDFRSDGGPDYSRIDTTPHWDAAEPDVLVLPTTGAYVGFLWRGGRWLHELAETPLFQAARLPGILSRLRALERVRLSPEGFDLGELRRLTAALLRRGIRVLSFSLHSPSALPGCTPYVRTDADLKAFLDTCRRYFDYVLGELGGVPATPLELRAHLSDPRSRA